MHDLAENIHRDSLLLLDWYTQLLKFYCQIQRNLYDHQPFFTIPLTPKKCSWLVELLDTALSSWQVPVFRGAWCYINNFLSDTFVSVLFISHFTNSYSKYVDVTIRWWATHLSYIYFGKKAIGMFDLGGWSCCYNWLSGVFQFSIILINSLSQVLPQVRVMLLRTTCIYRESKWLE